MDFTKKTVIVTGSARGIGRVIAERFASLGANLVISDVDLEQAESVAGEIGGSAIGLKADVTNQEDINNLFERTIKEFGQIDIVVNNAGITKDGLLIRMHEKDWDMVLDINLKGAFLVTKSAAKLMMKQRYGRIVNISSVVGLTGNAGQANYAASKAGLIGLTRSTAKELGVRGITVNAVAPGFIATDMTENLSEEVKETFLSKVLIKRAGTSDDIASAVTFLSSDEASYITGQVLTVDGGLTIN